MEGAPPVANQIDLFMHFLGASCDGLVARLVEMDKLSSSATLNLSSHMVFLKLYNVNLDCDVTFGWTVIVGCLAIFLFF